MIYSYELKEKHIKQIKVKPKEQIKYDLQRVKRSRGRTRLDMSGMLDNVGGIRNT